MSKIADRPSQPGPPDQFATTHWSLVLAAGDEQHPDSRAALGELCEAYWLPLYAYLRRSGRSPEDADDLTQGFFAALLERRDLQRVDPQLGKFRSFLLASLKHFVANEHDRRTAQKRGGGRTIVSLDVAAAESHFAVEPADEHTPEREFDRQWALTLLRRTLEGLRSEQERAGKGEHFERLKGFLTGEQGEGAYAELAREMESTEAALKQAVSRLRRRYRERLRQEISQTVSAPGEIDDEIRDLFAALRG
jgi:RNA polymerase sigma-70 factor (ECF subfamily)